MTKLLPKKTLRAENEEEKKAKVQNLAVKNVVNLVTIWRNQSEMKAKLDSVLSCIEDVKELKQKQTILEETNKQLEASLEFAYTSIKELREKKAVQDEAINELKKGVKSLTKQAAYEKERAIKLESHSRRNNLNFFNIPEKKDESFENSETILRNFMVAELKISKDVDDISFERVHRIGKSSPTESKPRPLIAKFTYHKDKEFVLSQAKNLRDTKFTVARDFPREIVDRRKLLLPTLKDAKKKGHTATLVYDKLYINGQL